MSMSACMSVGLCLSVCLSVRSHNSKTMLPNFTKFFVHMLTVAVARSFSNGGAICYVLPVLRVTSCFHIMRPVGGRTGTALCSSPAPVDVAAGQVRAAAAYWLAGSAGRLDGARRPAGRWLSHYMPAWGPHLNVEHTSRINSFLKRAYVGSPTR